MRRRCRVGRASTRKNWRGQWRRLIVSLPEFMRLACGRGSLDW